MRSIAAGCTLACFLVALSARADDGADPELRQAHEQMRELYVEGAYDQAAEVAKRMILRCAEAARCDDEVRGRLWTNLGRILQASGDGVGALKARERAAELDGGAPRGTDRERLATLAPRLRFECSPAAMSVAAGHPIPVTCRRTGVPAHDGTIEGEAHHAMPPAYFEARTTPDEAWSRLITHPKATLVWAVVPCEVVAGAAEVEVRLMVEEQGSPSLVQALALSLRPDAPVAAFVGNEAPSPCDAPRRVGMAPAHDALPKLRVVPLPGGAPELAVPPPGCGRCAVGDTRSQGAWAWALVALAGCARRRRSPAPRA